MSDQFSEIKKRADRYVHEFGKHSAEELEVARAIATATVAIYGSDDEGELGRIAAGKIWNDHVAVQAALAALRMATDDLIGRRA